LIHIHGEWLIKNILKNGDLNLMEQTPIHEMHNHDLLSFIPVGATRIVEVGCSSGALAREYKKSLPGCHYFGIEIDSEYAAMARRFCDQVEAFDIEEVNQDFWSSVVDRDCWVFGDTLEHLRNPWLILKRVYESLQPGGVVVACIPNAQHWSLQVRLNMGDFRYEPNGLLDKTHLRWFTRQTIVEMFHGAGFVIEQGLPRIFNEPLRERYLPIIREMANISGVDSDVAVTDSLPLQYVVRAVKE